MSVITQPVKLIWNAARPQGVPFFEHKLSLLDRLIEAHRQLPAGPRCVMAGVHASCVIMTLPQFTPSKWDHVVPPAGTELGRLHLEEHGVWLVMRTDDVNLARVECVGATVEIEVVNWPMYR